MLVDTGKTTTAKVYKDNLDFIRDKFPGEGDQDRINALVKDYIKYKKKRQENFIRWLGRKLHETDEEIEADVENYASDIV
jgi:hypothetical protein